MSILDLVLTKGVVEGSINGPIRVLGIDLGTTNSTVAEIVYDPADPKSTTIQCLAIEQVTSGRSHWNPLVPSVVALSDGRAWIGEGAKHLLLAGRSKSAIPMGNLFYNCKNDIGLQRTYAAAPEGYRNAAEVSSHILSFLYQGALKQRSQLPQRVTVTVPASFQMSQRADTAKAAKLAQIPTTGGDLLDEPIAAFIGYLADHTDENILSPGETKNLVVFDFGGGTCDVALFKISMELFPPLQIQPLSVSRYHRLGGSDIDQAIFYEVLLPQILKQNGLSPDGLDFDCKKYELEPAFIGLAEQLKTQLCELLVSQSKKGIEDMVGSFTATIHGEFKHVLKDGRQLSLTDPIMTNGTFWNNLKPFTDKDVLYSKDTEYRQTLSIFAPIHDALDRSNLDAEEVDICLLVGGSCLIPYVKDSLSGFFTKANMLCFDNPDDVQTVIARGAAINALSLALNNRPIIQPICQEVIAIKTQTGTIDLIPQGVPLPWPANGRYKKVAVLMVPESSDDEPVNLRIEVVSRTDSLTQTLLAAIWEIPAPVQKGEKIQLECRFDTNQVLKMRLTHMEREDVPPFKGHKEHPFTHVINPQKVRLRIDETEERLRTGQVNPAQWTTTMIKLAEDCAELKQYDKAMNRISDIMRRNNAPSCYLLNKMAILAGNMGDKKREEEMYKAAIEVDPDDGAPWFNLALLQQGQARLDEAKKSIQQAITIERGSSPYYVLQADITKQQGKDFAVAEILLFAEKCARPLEQQNDWEIGWSLTAAKLLGDEEKKQKIMAIKKKKRPTAEGVNLSCEGCLPGVLSGAEA